MMSDSFSETRPPSAASAPKTEWISVTSVLAVFALWWAASSLGWVSGKALPTPGAIADALWRFVTVGYQGRSLLDHTGASVFRAMSGLVIGCLVGIPLGLLMGYHPRVNAVFTPFLGFLRPIPALAFIPLVTLYLGIGELSKIGIISMAAFLYMCLYACTGVRNVTKDFLLLGLNLELTQWQLFRSVIFPASLSYIIAGFKTATAISWAIVVAAELIAAQAGLGYIVMDASTFFSLPDVCVGILFIGAIGFALELATNLVERKVVHWRGH